MGSFYSPNIDSPEVLEEFLNKDQSSEGEDIITGGDFMINPIIDKKAWGKCTINTKSRDLLSRMVR